MKVAIDPRDLLREFVAALKADPTLQRELVDALGLAHVPGAHLGLAAFAKAHSLGVSTVRAMCADGRLPAIKSGRRVLIPANAKIGSPLKRVEREESPDEFARRILSDEPATRRPARGDGS